MFIEALLLAAIQVLGTFLTFGLKSGSKKRTSMYRAIRLIRKIQIFDIITSIGFALYGSMSGTAIGAATGVASGLVNTILLQSLKTVFEQRYEAIWAIEYFLVFTDKERKKVSKSGKPSLTLAQGISLYRAHSLKEAIVHEYVNNYNGDIDNSITPDDRVFAGKTVGEWKDMGNEGIAKGKAVVPKAAETVGKEAGKLLIATTGALFRGIKSVASDGIKAAKERKEQTKWKQ